MTHALDIRARATRAWGAFAPAAILALSLSLSPSVAHAQQQGGEVSPLGYIEMPVADDGSYTLSSGVGSGRHWGRPEMIRFVAFAAKEWARRHPDKPRFRIGDMSKPDGTDFPPHKTHKDGLTMDLVTSPKNVCSIKYPDQDLTTELAELLVELGARQILYNHPQVIAAVKEVQEWPQHDGHFHVVIDPKRVPPDLGPMLVAAGPTKSGAAVGPAGFGKLGARPPKVSAREDGRPQSEGLRVMWDFLGDARGFQRGYRVRLEPLRGAEGLAAFDSGEQKGAKTWHVIDGAFPDGAKLRWAVDVLAADGSTHTLGWQEIAVDLASPDVAAVEPAEGAKVAAQPTFRWRYQDPTRQATARVEVRRKKAKSGLALDPVRGDAQEFAAPLPLPRGALEWRVVCEDAAGNEGASPWTPFEVE